jgi:hypothetical protein
MKQKGLGIGGPFASWKFVNDTLTTTNPSSTRGRGLWVGEQSSSDVVIVLLLDDMIANVLAR